MAVSSTLSATTAGKWWSRRTLLRALVGGTISLGGMAAYATLVEPFWLEFVERELPVRHLPHSLAGKRVMQISDIHVSDRVSTPYLIESLITAAQWKPDIVVYTGDFITLSEGTRQHLDQVFPHLPRGSMATAAVLGNHDTGDCFGISDWTTHIVNSLTDVGVTVLRNDILSIEGLQLIGLDDLWCGNFSPPAAFEYYRQNQAAVVLSHNPDSLDEPGWDNYRGWVLSGHTHGGQCKSPFLPAPILPVKNRLYQRGHVALTDGRDLYINRGLGYLYQVRFNVRPEITIHTLRVAS